MKKLLAMLLALVMVCSLVTGCGSESKEPEPVETESKMTEQTTAPATEAPEQPDETEETAEGPQETVEPTFNRADEATWDVSVDVAAVLPCYGIYSEGNILASYKKSYRQAICKCLTTDGSIEWLYIEIDDYKLFFDKDARLNFDAFLAFDMVTPPEPIRIEGTVTDADSLVSGLSDTIGSDTVIFFGNATVQSGESIHETAYNSETGAMTCVYSEVVSINPAYTLSSNNISNTHVICQAKDAGGADVWIAMSIADYNAYIDETASLEFSGSLSFEEKTFDTPLVIHGVSVEADSLSSGLSSSTGSTTVMQFSRVDE